MPQSPFVHEIVYGQSTFVSAHRLEKIFHRARVPVRRDVDLPLHDNDNFSILAAEGMHVC